MYKAEYCLSESKCLGGEFETVAEVVEWVNRINKQYGIKQSIFNDEFHVQKEKFEQWGTGYRWLTIITDPTPLVEGSETNSEGSPPASDVPNV